MNQITILFFASIRDRTGIKSTALNIPNDMTVLQLKEKLGEEYPNLKAALGSALVSVNREYAFDDSSIPANAELALFPPVSGG